ncbi:hypothetical protein EC973_001644 [Apophysomyces ossiformis]|uniref:DAGKc domain-containing protein n=1 Tax=Apophysomyces ossiformis TaxID=679940 RepID=A0A8H7BY39_9FUNG|nr:hypothetical protein EC973_001644 [Apophysomyces ossiformis]
MAFPAVVQKNNQTAELSLHDSTVTITYSCDRLTDIIPIDTIYAIHASADILTFHICRALTEDDEGFRETLTDVRAAPEWKLETQQYTSAQAEKLAEALKQHPSFHSLSLSTRFYVLINPAAGARQAEEQWRDTVRPMLEKAGLRHFEVHETHAEDGQTRQQAAAIGRQILGDVTPTPAVVLVLGGDGTLHDVVNGLSDVVETNNINSARSRFRIGVIPCGSGNAFSHSLNLHTVSHATLRIIKGVTEPFRLMDVVLGSAPTMGDLDKAVYDCQTQTRLLVVMSWGFHAQIVSRARKMDHTLGNVRFAMAAKELMNPLVDYIGTVIAVNARRYIGKDAEGSDPQGFGPQETVRWSPGQFTYFLVTKQHSLERGFKIAPFASHSSEEMDVIILREATAEQLTTASIKAFQGGRHVEEKDAEYYKTSELFLQVYEPAEVCLDGEIQSLPANGVVHVKVTKEEPYLEAFSGSS